MSYLHAWGQSSPAWDRDPRGYREHEPDSVEEIRDFNEFEAPIVLFAHMH
jgi:hypothetical protein